MQKWLVLKLHKISRTYPIRPLHKRSIQRFKLPFDAVEGQGETQVNGRVGIIVVNNMLLTGFDAPIEQVMYLDKVVTDHNLLQAIARVNRVGDEFKEKGFVVDYVGVGHHLKRALDAYAEREQEEIIDALGNECFCQTKRGPLDQRKGDQLIIEKGTTLQKESGSGYCN